MKHGLLLVLAGGLVLAPRAADACGMDAVGEILADIAVKAFESRREPISAPVVVLGGGTTTEGLGGSVAVGWTWGARETGGLFPGASVQRVLLEARRSFDATAYAITYGWKDTTIVPGAFDIGVGAWRSDREDMALRATTLVEDDAASGIGPLARLTLGDAIGVRLTAGAQVTGDTRFVGGAELVVDVAALARR